MSLSFVQLFDQYPETIAETIDLTLQQYSATGGRYQRGLPDPALTRFMPITRYADPRLAIQKLDERRPTLAFIVGVDQDIPVRREPVTLSQELVGSAKIARGRLFTEEDYDLMRDAETYLQANNPDMYAAFVERYMQTPAQLTQSINILAAVLMLQVFVSGACTYIDPTTLIGFELSYLSQVPAAHRPAALSGGALWSAPTTATPLPNLRDHLNAYFNSIFMMPEAIVMSSTAADAMLNADDTRIKIGRWQGRITDSVAPNVSLAAQLPRPTIEECRAWLGAEITAAAQGSVNVPQFIVSDAQYFTLAANGQTNANATPFFPANTYWFANSGILEGAYVPTATNGYQNQMAFVTEEISKAPKRERASMDTRFLVLCKDPRMLGWRQVLA